MGDPQKQPYEKALAEATGPTPNWREVLKLLRRAIKQGSYEATYALATWHIFGKEPYVKKDIREAIRLLRIAASGGITEALLDLGYSYEAGIGNRKNSKLAFEYYLKAAIRGNGQSIFEVGRLLWEGTGTERNRRLANIWFDRAWELGTYNDGEE